MNANAPVVITIPAKPKEELQQAQKQLRVAAYCRVSTKDEDQINSYEAQKNYYTDKIMTNPEWTLAGIFADKGITGTQTKNRKEFLRMIRYCRQNKIDIILTKNNTRFARNTVDCLKYIRILRDMGVAVVFEEEHINTLEMDSELIITILGAVAQGQSEAISQNVAWGQRQAYREGKVNFHYANLYGYKRGPDDKPEIIPEQAEVIRRIFKDYLDGKSVRAIKEWLDAEGIKTAKGRQVWSAGVILRMLRNEKYCGDVLCQKTYTRDCISKVKVKNVGQLPMYLIQNHHTPIVDRATFDAVQAEVARRTGTAAASIKTAPTGKSRYNSKYVLSERLICGDCGTRYRRAVWSKGGNKRPVWRCISRLDYGTKYCPHSPTLEEAPLQNAIMIAIATVMSDKENLIAQITSAMQMELAPTPGQTLCSADIDRRLDELTLEMQSTLAKGAEAGDLEFCASRFQMLTDEMTALKAEKNRIAANQRRNEHVARRIDENIKILQTSSPIPRQWDELLVRQLVETVTVLSKTRIKVTFMGGKAIEQEVLK